MASTPIALSKTPVHLRAKAPELGQHTEEVLIEGGYTWDEIDALRSPDVAWRGIAWKTCLLDGLRASREEKKPVVLWVFIDRPVDDARC